EVAGSQVEPKMARAMTPAGAYRDFAGVVLVTPEASVLQEWLLSQDGATLTTRTCPVGETRGAKFAACTSWSAPEPVSSVGLAGPVRSFSAYLFPQADGSIGLEESVFDMSCGTRSERGCAIVDGDIDESACGDWTSSEDAVSLGVPQQRAFDDEVVVSYVDSNGDLQVSQDLVSLTGSKAWSRTCSAADTSPCSFSDAVSLSELGIHYPSIEGIGGYTYADGDQIVYAETIIAPGGAAGARRTCPVSGANGVELDKCGSWERVDFGAIAATNDAVL
ncbi:MAG: hypothetical protein ACRELY_02460, partial [Polyangiaceae bacterium]